MCISLARAYVVALLPRGSARSGWSARTASALASASALARRSRCFLAFACSSSLRFFATHDRQQHDAQRKNGK